MVISTGIDIVKNDRMELLVSSGAIFSIFSEQEYSYCRNKKNVLQSMGGIYAAKEAVIKCFGKGVTMKDINILHEDSGKPYAQIKGFKEKVSVSISHDAEYSVAFALANINQ